MQTAIWTALAGGTGALVGTIGAQVVSGLFTKRRAEDAKKVDQWGHWRNERLDAYSDYIAQVARWAERSFEVVDVYRQRHNKSEPLSLRERIKLLDDAINEYQLIAAPYSKVQVLGSDEVNHKVSVLNEYVYSYHLVAKLTVNGLNDESEQGEYLRKMVNLDNRRETFEREFRELLDAIVVACRNDLGIKSINP